MRAVLQYEPTIYDPPRPGDVFVHDVEKCGCDDASIPTYTCMSSKVIDRHYSVMTVLVEGVLYEGVTSSNVNPATQQTTIMFNIGITYVMWHVFKRLNDGSCT